MYCITGKYRIYFNLALRSRFAVYLSTEPLFSCADFWYCDLYLVFWVTIAVAKYYILCLSWKYNYEDNITYFSTNMCIYFILLREGQGILNPCLLKGQFLQWPMRWCALEPSALSRLAPSASALRRSLFGTCKGNSWDQEWLVCTHIFDFLLH